MKTFPAISILIFSLISFNAQSLPTDRLTDWSGAGASLEIPDRDSLNIRTMGAKGDSATVNDSILDQAIDSLADQNGGTIYMPPGDYLFESRIDLKEGVWLAGQGSYKTQLIFDAPGQDLIRIHGSPKQAGTEITQPANRGGEFILAKDPGVFEEDEPIEIKQDGEPVMEREWAYDHYGQIVQAEGLEGDTIYIDPPLRINLEDSLNPRINKVDWITDSGVSCLGIFRTNETEGQTSNISFRYAHDARVNAVASEKCNFSHVELSQSANITVENSFFRDAFDHGGGGNAYGVTTHLIATDNLVENNIFQELRHSMLLQAGANGNVFVGNFSDNPIADDPPLPEDFTGDIVLHGNYPHHNLFEHNVVQTFSVDGYHGINGPNNTFFRNQAERYGLYTSNDPPTDSQIYIGNHIPADQGQFLLNGEGHWLQANHFRDSLIPESTELPDAAGLFYADGPPEFWHDDFPWPSIPHQESPSAFTNPAQQRYEEGEYTVCEARQEPETSLNPNRKTGQRFQASFHPVPFREQFTINFKQSLNKEIMITLHSLNGKQKFETSERVNNNEVTITPKDINPGVYVVQVLDVDGNTDNLGKILKIE